MPVTTADRKALSKLPLSLYRWEVALVEMYASIQGVETEGMLVIVEQETGNVRAGMPIVVGAPLWPAIREACLSPASPCAPSRPRALCTTSDLAARCRREVEGSDLPVEVQATLPHVEQFEQAWASHARPLRPPDLSADGPLWRQTLALLCQIEPWRELPDRVTFRFDTSDPDLAAAVAVVLGKAGEQEGVALYRTEDCYNRVRTAALSGKPDFSGIDALCLYIDPLADLRAEEIREVKASNLILPGGRAPRLVAVDGDRRRSASPKEHRMLLAASEAIAPLPHPPRAPEPRAKAGHPLDLPRPADRPLAPR